MWTDAISGWISTLTAGGASKETIRNRRGIVGMTARRVPVRSPARVTGEHLMRLASSYQWSNDYRRQFRTTETQFFGWCIDHRRHPGPNPALVLPRVPESKPKPRPATDEIWLDLLAAAAPRELLMARLAGEAGLRRAEVAQLHRDDLSNDSGGWLLIVRGKGDKQRVVPITAPLAQAIRSHSAGYSPHGFVFPGQDGGHLSPNRVGVLISGLMPPGWSMHKLRHRYASRGYAGTHDIRAVQEALGHASVATTQRYTAVTSNDVRRVSESAA
jgi:integrase